jgi:hypothetical protein
MDSTNSHRYFFPVVGFRKKDFTEPINIFGTASLLGNGVFITTAHTIKAARECASHAILFMTDDDTFTMGEPIDFELFEDYDLGLLKLTHYPNVSAYPWDEYRGFMTEPVQALGYPHGYDAKNNFITMRALIGHIVSYMPFHLFPNKPLIYELSFPCPRGISGAPIMTASGIKGFVIGNSLTEITVFKEEETVDDGSQRVVHEKTETTKFGVAIAVSNLLPLTSRLLGSTFREHLISKGLLNNSSLASMGNNYVT